MIALFSHLKTILTSDLFKYRHAYHSLGTAVSENLSIQKAISRIKLIDY